MTVRVPAARYEKRVLDRFHAGTECSPEGFGSDGAGRDRHCPGEQVRSGDLGDVIGGSFQEAIAQEKLRPAMSPRIARDADAPKEELVYTATFDVMPEVARSMSPPGLAADSRGIDVATDGA